MDCNRLLKWLILIWIEMLMINVSMTQTPMLDPLKYTGFDLPVAIVHYEVDPCLYIAELIGGIK